MSGTSFLLRQIIIGLFIMVLSAAAGLTFNGLRPTPLPLFQNWDDIAANKLQNSNTQTTINLEQMKELIKKDGTLVLDGRSSLFYEMEHIPGSKNLPIEEADERLPGLLKELAPQTLIITYCDGATCHISHDLAEKIKATGWKNVVVYPGGINEWLGHGMPTAGGLEG